eukprot:TRINITY_DN2558_c0_g1_i4.p1 TRINITY_DN2558_c0_g1~~TRINITY_DN2558_c0_g1_i4.p1  ORF type:complete len:799 (+),score=271.42 TRINITY_DN2558_c0_g1_i4:148-2544(+)
MSLPSDSKKLPLELEEQIVKQAFGVTLNPLETGLVFLPLLLQQTNTVKNLASFQFSGGTQPAPRASGAISSFDLANALRLATGAQPAPVTPNANPLVFTAPCAVCKRPFALEQLLGHQDDCTDFVEQPPAPAAELTSASAPATRLDRTMARAVMRERQTQLGSGTAGARWLIECAGRIDKLRSQAPHQQQPQQPFAVRSLAPPTADDASVAELLAALHNDVVISLKETIMLSHRAAHMQPSLFGPLLDVLPAAGLLPPMLAACASDAQRVELVGRLMAELASDIHLCTAKSMLDGGVALQLKRMAALINEPACLAPLAGVLTFEVGRAAQSTARQLQNESVLAPMLLVSPVVTPFEKSAFNIADSLLPGFPSGVSRSDVEQLEKAVRGCLGSVQQAAHGLLKKLLSSAVHTKQPTLDWLACLLGLNSAHAERNTRDPLFVEMSLMMSSDGFLLNLMAVLLLFCKPFVDPHQAKMSAVNVDYVLRQPGRGRLDFSKFAVLADGTFTTTTTVTAPGTGADSSHQQHQEPAAVNFITEAFFMTYYALHVGFMPALAAYMDYAQQHQQIRDSIHELETAHGDAWKTTPDGAKLDTASERLSVLLEGLTIQMLDPQLLDLLARFSHFAIAWMMSLIHPSSTVATAPAKHHQPQSTIVSSDVVQLISRLPEFFVRDLAEVVTLLLRHQPQLLLSVSGLLSLTIDWIVTLLNAPSMVRSPIVRARLCGFLCEIASRNQHELDQQAASGWARRGQLGQQLGLVLQTNTSAQLSLAPGLMKIFVDVDIVEGLLAPFTLFPGVCVWCC